MCGLHRYLIPLLATTLNVACSKNSDQAEAPAAKASAGTAKGEATNATAVTKTAAMPWPQWPTTTAELTALLRTHAQRPLAKDHLVGLTARGLLQTLVKAQQQGQLSAGWQAISGALQALAHGPSERAPVYYLFGSFHDAGGQVAAFRRLVGPGGLGDLSSVPLEIVAEQLDARGQWRGLAATEQQGDDALLSAYRRDGSARSYAALRARQRKLDYTAWKYRYLHEVLGLAVDARASGRVLYPCDMPRALQARARKIADAKVAGQLLRLRELHCLTALRARLRRTRRATPERVAMLWGQDHVGPHAVQRLLPPRARAIAIYLFGHRPGPHGLEGTLATRLALTHPVLVPLDGLAAQSKARYRQFALLLPGRRLAAHWNQTRDPGSARADRQRTPLRVLSERAAELLLPGKGHRLTAGRARWLAMPEPRTFVLRATSGLIVGSLELAAEGQLELDIDARRRRVEALLRTP